MALHGKPIDAYRLFFPLGIVLGTFGVAIWPLYNYGMLDGFSGRAHAFVQTNGFLYAFILGFLLTAIPRFTGTEPPSRPVQYVLAGIVTVSALAFELQVPLVGHTGFVAAHGMLLVLAVRRFRRRRQDPPETFVLIGIAFISGALGGLINAGVAWNALGPAWDLLGKRLLTEGMMLLLVLGVGGFLGPRLLGFAALPQIAARALRAAFAFELNQSALRSFQQDAIRKQGSGFRAFIDVGRGCTRERCIECLDGLRLLA